GKSMAKRAKILLALGLTSALTATSSFGQFSFDENGNGFGPGGPIPGLISIDPLTGLPALRYQLPFPTAPGDVLLVESGSTNVVSDIFRFVQNNLYVYSERELNEPNPDLADVVL